MLKTIARVLLLRVLPRRILPVVTLLEAFLFLRGIRNRSRTKVNPPTASRSAKPAWPTPPTSGATDPTAPTSA